MPSMLYDSDSFVVVHEVGNNDEITDAMVDGKLTRAEIDLRVRHIYEIVDKRNDREVCLHGAWAETFLRITKEWEQDPPEQEVVERILDGYCQLATLPMIVH